MNKMTVPEIRSMKAECRKIVMVTAYDAATARMVDEAGVDIVLVGDSLGNVIQGLPNTLAVTMDEMIYHTKIVSRGIDKAHLTADMPFMSYQASKEDALRSAGRFIKESGAESVKLETSEEYLETVYAINKSGIPVMAHIGLRPQSVLEMGGYKIQGRSEKEAAVLLELAKSIESAGAFSLVLESIPQSLAKEITDAIKIPTIGIGAGPGCDGQVLVINDLLGLSPEPTPRFVKKYANLREIVGKSTRAFISDVRSGAFPSEEHSYD
ncbi:MAG: 3-methyl-2-oxobutanoate hydroxymethyltransferase [Thermodesulfobacteriota bacterium]